MRGSYGGPGVGGHTSVGVSAGGDGHLEGHGKGEGEGEGEGLGLGLGLLQPMTTTPTRVCGVRVCGWWWWWESAAAVYLALCVRHAILPLTLSYYVPLYLMALPSSLTAALGLAAGAYSLHGARTWRKVAVFLVGAGVEASASLALLLLVGGMLEAYIT